MQVPGFLKWLVPGQQKDSGLLPVTEPSTAYDGVKERIQAGTGPSGPDPSSAPLAPWPSIDRYPVILGSNVSLAYISSVFRLALTGYRREFCDLLDELLERDPHLYGVVAQRVHAVSGGEVSFTAADCGEDEQDIAEEIRDFVERAFDGIADRQQALSQLQWGGIYYGVGASETSWSQTAMPLKPRAAKVQPKAPGEIPRKKLKKAGPQIPGQPPPAEPKQDPEPEPKPVAMVKSARINELAWLPIRLHWIHSRRLAYPDPNNWKVRVWDQGMVTSYDPQRDPTARIFGIATDEFPGKFIVHTPSVRGNYPTRDGLGRECAYWSALKLMGARGASQYIERFGKPWVIGTYTTGEKEGEHRAAGKEDLVALEAASRALGLGSLASAMLPDSAKIELIGPGSNGTPGRQLLHVLFLNACNSEMSKAVLGQTDTTEPGPNGSRGAVEVRKQGTQELYRYDAACLADTLQQHLVRWIVILNFGEELLHLAPKVSIQAVEEPDLTAIVERATKLAMYGAPVDVDALGEEVGVKMTPLPKSKTLDGEPETRRLYPMALLKPIDVQDMQDMENGIALEHPEPPLPPGFGEKKPGEPGAKTTGNAPSKAPTKKD